MNRRRFLQVLVGVFAFLNFAQAEEKRRGGAKAAAPGEKSFVKPGEGMAASVKYVEDIKDWKDAALKIDRQGVKWGQQHCENCALYTKDDATSGKCTLFSGQHVKANGICASWSKKV